jgi:transposase InsO family protein
MRQAKILPKAIRRFQVTTDSRNTTVAAPNLVNREFYAARPDACWLSDITYIPTREGWLYLAAILDLHSRAVAGWAMSRTLDCRLAMEALKMAISRRGASPAVLHSDRGSTYAAAEYRALLGRHAITQSMSRKGNCWDTQSKIASERRTDLTRVGIGRAALVLTCRSGSGVPRALPGPASVT